MAAKKKTTAQAAKPKPLSRLSNEEISSLIGSLYEAVEKERNIRTVRENVLNRENAFQLDGIMQKLKAMRLQFDLFTKPSRGEVR
jgi:hypothetical protein